FIRSRTLQETVERLAEIPLLFQPGTRWHYSLAVDVLGHVIQVAADMPLADFLKERMFKPLGMTDTDFYVPAEKANRLAQIYDSEALYNPRPIDPEKVMLIGDITQPTASPSSGAGLASTLNDYLQFANCLLNGGAYDGG